MPCRGAAAGAGRRDDRRPDRGQDRAVGLGRAPRSFLILAGQRLDLGADADGARSGRRPARPCPRAARPRQAHGRAGGAHGRRPVDEDPRSPVRAGPDHRGGHEERPRAGEEGLYLFLRHARRGGAHQRGCQALSCRLRQGDQRHRQAGQGRRTLIARHFGQAVGPASALRIHPQGHGDEGAAAPRARPRQAGSQGGHRLQHRRRGTGPSRPVTRRDRGDAVGQGARGVGRFRHRRAGLRAPRRPGDRDPLRHGRAP